jgi:hypothetical protein
LRNVEGAIRKVSTSCSRKGNAFEAEVVVGVEDAEDNGEREARTYEVPEDDVRANTWTKDE